LSKLIGRANEQAALAAALDSPEAELVAIYGRRRVGKTFLVREFFKPRADLFFEFTGQKDASLSQQLFNFKDRLEQTFYQGTPIPRLASWNEAFRTLAQVVKVKTEQAPDNNIVIFLDELPWMATPRSRLLQALDYTWNTELSQLSQVTLIVCGSAASWMIDNLIQAKGGLHNRITRQIRLMPFTLTETRAYFKHRKMKFGLKSVIELYMALGGIPHYLRQVESSKSASQNISSLCFSPQGSLTTEFERLYDSLFGESEIYDKITRILANTQQGLTRDELIEQLGVHSGGSINRRLKELQEAGFITRMTPYNKSTKHTVFRVIDPYTLFYLRWIEKAPKGVFTRTNPNYWTNKYQTAGYKSWAGYAFENLCLTHSHLVAKALGIDNVLAQAGNWNYRSPLHSKTQEGAQIDLLFDRTDNTITLCEIKYHVSPFSVNKSYAKELKRKIEVFEHITRTKKDIRVVMITLNGFKENTWSIDLVDQSIDADSIFS